jgi:hypothetical protein
MQPYELIRHAADLIRAQGWSQGGAARDVTGEIVQLLDVGRAGDSRVRVNPRAVSFSIYGALVKAQELYGEPTQVGLMWDTLMRLAREAGDVADGGTNYVHPVIQYNETEGRTVDEVLALLERAAAATEAQINPADQAAP